MLRIRSISNTARAIAYYTNHLSKDDYYTGEQLLPSRWSGKLCSKVGLREGDVVNDIIFERLATNLDPLGIDKLSARVREDRRIGFDLTFCPPKSISLQALVAEDNRIILAFDNSVDYTMRQLERDAMGRVRKNNANEDRVTSNMLWVNFTHSASRPVNGLPDPFLHSHVIAFNLTHDPVEKQIKALQLGYVKTHAPYFQQIFHNQLAFELRNLGYDIRTTDYAFELSHIDDQTIRAFSNRTNEIESLMEQLTVKSDKVRDQMGARTRQPKTESFSRVELIEKWQVRMEKTDLEKLIQIKERTKQTPTQAIQQPFKFKPFDRQDKPKIADTLKRGLEHGLKLSDLRIRKEVVKSNNEPQIKLDTKTRLVPVISR